MATRAADAVPGMVSNESIKLFNVLQHAITSVGEGAAGLGLMDLVTVGQEAAGKSSVLGAMSGIKLPVGPRKTTRSPIRINIQSEGEHSFLKLPGHPPEHLGADGLDVLTYQKALKVITEGQDFHLDPEKVTDREVTVEVGREDQPPLSILDLPGLVINSGNPYKNDIDQLVSNVLNATEEDTHLLPILIVKASDNINNILAHLVQGQRRSFVTVMTFANYLQHSHGDQKGQLDMAMYDSMLETKKDLGSDCKGFFLVSVPEGKDAPTDWYENLCNSSQLDQEKKTELLKMCGIPALLRALHEIQFSHLLDHLYNVESKLKAKLQEISPCLKVFDKNPTILQKDFCDRLQQVQMAVKAAVDEEKSYLPACGDQKDILVHEQVNNIIEMFSDKSLKHVLEITKERWGSTNASRLASPTLTENWQTQVLNASACRWEILKADFFGETLVQLQRCLKQHILTCFNECAQQWHGARSRFEEFLDKYIEAKWNILNHEAEMMKMEGPLMKLSIHIPFVHWLLAQDQQLAGKLTVDYLFESLQSFNQDEGNPIGGFGPMALVGQYDDFSAQWKKAQKASFVLVFIFTSQMVEHLVNRMMTVLFYRTFHIIQTTVTEHDTSMANLTLEKAFERHCADQGEQFSFQSWLAPGLEAMKEQKEALDTALKHLRHFDGHKGTARSLGKSQTTRSARRAPASSPRRESGAAPSQREQWTSPAPAPHTPPRPFNNLPFQNYGSEDPTGYPQTGRVPGGSSAGSSRVNNGQIQSEQQSPMPPPSYRRMLAQAVLPEVRGFVGDMARQVRNDVEEMSGVRGPDI